MSRRVAIRGILGIAISVAAAYVLLRSVDVGAAIDVLRQANLAIVALMAVCVVFDVASRAARWRSLLAPIARIRYLRVLGYTFVGYLANNVLPARLGELVRSHALGEGEGLSRTTVLGTVVVERIVDTVIVVGLAALAVLTLGVGGIVSTAVVLGAIFVGVLVVILALSVVSHRLPGAERATALVERVPRLLDLARRLRDGLSVVSKPRTVIAAIGFSVLAWTFSILTFVLGGAAIGIEITPLQGALMTSGVALATIVPSGPGYLGTFELTAVGIASRFGIDRDTAFAMALLVHAMILLVTSVGGAISAVRLGVGLSTGSEDEVARVEPVRGD
ncbi:MAG TPA: lysylphosphatidylglycerol synthase transmembrane domain-containing protein [Marmoricola sp.]|nr:lysylphosphatidylglycerol synthase transmembrane domain-containing protein [Marmoricola sp.]